MPLSDTAISTVQGVMSAKDRPRNATHLFTKPDGSRYGDVKKGFAAACRRARVIGLRWHDLRHTFASWFVQAGGDLYHLSRNLGHSTVQMTTRYSHLRTQDLHTAIERAAQNRAQDRLTGGAA